ncbi:MAG: hypothetical protein QXJ74_06645 [Nitrososphaera sp.]|jgi:hypothetical protein|uniref:hypothetical protein n=1 Tax=Nitrososphaera sp. TaxID=1971748 RepID=UPI0017BD90E1|nr:hypothetical protein [Nitrososphaera sp.]NWG36067.1 hypothetical protein [Nitrososphaera sp.]
MNKPIIVAMAVLAVFFSATAVSVMPAAYAQYGVEGSPVAGATEEQLAECEQYGIAKSECTENAILAKRRLIYAQDNPSTGSGTPMLSTQEGQTWVFIGVLAAIFGGVAAAFFFRGRGATPPS